MDCAGLATSRAAACAFVQCVLLTLTQCIQCVESTICSLRGGTQSLVMQLGSAIVIHVTCAERGGTQHNNSYVMQLGRWGWNTVQ